MITLIKSVEEWRALSTDLKNQSLGLVTTMGNLHEGHMALLKRSISENEATVLSCFVNRAQFNTEEDFARYPRSLEKDLAMCETAGVDYFFAPTYAEMYPDDYRYKVSENGVKADMESEYRPGHFDGVLTVVMKLLLLLKPNRAYFGEKDYQQFQLVQGMVDAFFLDTEIVPCSTIRSESGLALSSRNRRLTKDQLAIASYFPQYLRSDFSCEEIAAALTEKGFKVEYIKEFQGRRFAAVCLGEVRLIDNVQYSQRLRDG